MLVSQWVVYMIYMSFLVINVTWAAKGGSKYMHYYFHILLRTLGYVSEEISRNKKPHHHDSKILMRHTSI